MSDRLFDPTQLATCISCGFCLPACPTFRLTGDEAASPRGRIALMRAIDSGEINVFDAAAREQGSFCLGCRACEPVCPANVPYGQLLEQLRDAQWTGRHRPARVRALLAIARRTWLIRAISAVRRPAAFTPVRPPADQLLLGCFERILFPAVSRAAAATVRNIDVPRTQGCCGALHAHNGDSVTGAHMARRLGEGKERIVSTSGGCSAHIASVLGRGRVADYAEVLLEQEKSFEPIVIDGRRARIGLQDSCHLRNGLDVHAEPRRLIAALGELVELPGAADCCGAAGTYSILRRRDSQRVLAPKIAALKDLDLDFLAVLNPGCQRQLVNAVRSSRIRTNVLHLAQLVDLALKRGSSQRGV
jgi:glycolate oxidase iron-sulfur subunit